LKTSGPHAIAMYLGTPAIHTVLGALAYVGFARALGTRNVYSAGSQDNASKMVASRLVQTRRRYGDRRSSSHRKC
jgi:hypothetical protein